MKLVPSFCTKNGNFKLFFGSSLAVPRRSRYDIVPKKKAKKKRRRRKRKRRRKRRRRRNKKRRWRNGREVINNRTEIVTPSPARILFFLGLNRSASVVSFFLFRFFLLLLFFKLFFFGCSESGALCGRLSHRCHGNGRNTHRKKME